MDRRKFIRGIAAAGMGSAFGAAFGAEPSEGDRPRQPLERRELGRSGERLSIIGFGGIIVRGHTAAEAADYVAEAVDRGVNYFDVAPSYGDAEERLGPALKPHRERCFLSCKTLERSAEGAQRELENSLRLLETDRFDLYQFHSLSKLEDVEAIFAPGGAMEAVERARAAGQVRLIGFSAHSSEAALAMLERYEFDSIMFPFNFAAWHKGEFGPEVLERARERNVGLLALKALARRRFANREERLASAWPKAWYLPIDEAGLAGPALRFTLNLPVTSAIPPGDWGLFKLALELAQSPIAPLSEAETEQLIRVAREDAGTPIFPV